ncbi:MAG: 4Fe-4S dicluster domain-containing protein [Actinobacteria bacterium]|nr:4Fe-4S dicluster domain-containing protein [Actinomycetota bacterium]
MGLLSNKNTGSETNPINYQKAALVNFPGSIEIPNEETIINCIHCGMCLSVCPTYQLTGMEKSSPRGRIRLIKIVAEGNLDLTPNFIDEMDFCLDCQACQTVCPAGVKFGQLVEASRDQIANVGKDPQHFRKRFFFRFIFPSHARLKIIAAMLRLYQKFLQKILRKIGFFHLLPKKLGRMDQLAPKISDKFSDKILKEDMRPKGEIKYRVGFLKGCLMNVMFADINKDTVDVLLENDCEVIMPKNQVCCGSLAAHNGDFKSAKSLAKKNIIAFLAHDLDAIVINSAGCSAFMKEYGELLQDDPEYSDKAKELSAKVKDVHEFLVEIDFKQPKFPVQKKITYHDACHLAHSQQITDEPRRILQAIPGLEIVELNESTMCCGSAGIYNMVRYDDSMKLLKRKVDNIVDTQAEVVIAANPGCAGQIEYGLRNREIDIKVMNPMTLLKMSYGLPPAGETE